ncbi:MAG TPA: tetratricopeptide repeat protein [Pyrinomonadaceae bacterium]|jgi:Tfp pilus assembly protein PilF|nr:tetratricopeptide repeat protein [Pyrinomonadaceae bacterium]
MKVRARLRHLKRPLVFSALLIVITGFDTFAQTDPNATKNTIQGDIITPNGQRLDHPVIVWLSSNRGEISTTSNGNGSFFFRQLGGGRFTVRVDVGDTYEPATEVVNIQDAGTIGNMSRMGQIYSVQIHLRLKSNQPITKGVISANDPPKAAVDLYNKALESVKNGHRDKAIEQLKGALAIHPTFAAALNGLGVQYLKLGKYDAASEAFTKALKITPESFILHLNSGISLFSLRRHAEAETQFAAALAKNETSGTAHLYRARALIALNRLDDAALDLKRAIEIGGDDVKLAHRYLAGIYVEKGENVEAVKQLELYLKVSPDSKETEQIRNLIKELNKKTGRE